MGAKWDRSRRLSDVAEEVVVAVQLENSKLLVVSGSDSSVLARACRREPQCHHDVRAHLERGLVGWVELHSALRRNVTNRFGNPESRREQGLSELSRALPRDSMLGLPGRARSRIRRSMKAVAVELVDPVCASSGLKHSSAATDRKRVRTLTGSATSTPHDEECLDLDTCRVLR